MLLTVRQTELHCIDKHILYLGFCQSSLCCSVQDIAMYQDEMHGAAVSVTAKKDKNDGQYKVLASFPLMLNSSIIFTLTIVWSCRFIYYLT